MILETKDLVAGYGNKQVLKNVTLSLQAKEILAIVGHNGAGKSTLLHAIFGLVPCWSGRVIFEGQDITRRPPQDRVPLGISLMPQGRGLFPDLTVMENLELGGYSCRKRVGDMGEQIKIALELFPVLGERQQQKAGTLSGGQQQMLAIGRSIVASPVLLMLDEPSLGLAPVLVEQVINRIGEINRLFGTAIIVVEQNLKECLKIATRFVVIKSGAKQVEASPAEFQRKEDLWALF